MAEVIPVSFEGPDSGEAVLTWGQQHIWDWIQKSGFPMSLSVTRTLDDGATVEEFVEELRFFMTRFQAMRTRLRFDGTGRPWQVVSRSGEVSLRIVEAEDGSDPAAAAATETDVHKGSHFDYTREWPVRMSLVRHRGRLTHLVTTLCRLVIDSPAATVMSIDLKGRDPQTGEPAGPVSGIPPLQLAHWQLSPAGQRQSEAALRHWEHHLRSVAIREPVEPKVEGERYWRLRYQSPAMSLALRLVADRLRTNETAHVMLALFAVALSRITGRDPVVFQVFVGNRHRPGFADIVSPVSQPGLCVLDLGGLSLDEAIAHTRRRAIDAYQYAYYDQFRHTELMARLSRERGAELDLECFVNDRRTTTTVDNSGRRPTGEEVRAALPRSTLRAEVLDPVTKKLMFTVSGDEAAVAVTVEADTEYLARPDLDALVREIEAVAVEAALA